MLKKKLVKKEVSRMKNGYIIDTLSSVDSCEIVKFDGRVIEFFEAV